MDIPTLANSNLEDLKERATRSGTRIASLKAAEAFLRYSLSLLPRVHLFRSSTGHRQLSETAREIGEGETEKMLTVWSG